MVIVFTPALAVEGSEQFIQSAIRSYGEYLSSRNIKPYSPLPSDPEMTFARIKTCLSTALPSYYLQPDKYPDVQKAAAILINYASNPRRKRLGELYEQLRKKAVTQNIRYFNSDKPPKTTEKAVKPLAETVVSHHYENGSKREIDLDGKTIHYAISFLELPHEFRRHNPVIISFAEKMVIFGSQIEVLPESLKNLLYKYLVIMAHQNSITHDKEKSIALMINQAKADGKTSELVSIFIALLPRQFTEEILPHLKEEYSGLAQHDRSSHDFILALVNDLLPSAVHKIIEECYAELTEKNGSSMSPSVFHARNLAELRLFSARLAKSIIENYQKCTVAALHDRLQKEIDYICQNGCLDFEDNIQLLSPNHSLHLTRIRRFHQRHYLLRPRFGTSAPRPLKYRLIK